MKTDEYLEKTRKQRTFRKEDVDAMPTLPDRVTFSEVKDYGMVHLAHTEERSSAPWIKAGWYKVDKDGSLFVLEVLKQRKGDCASAWLYRPIIRVPGG